MCGIAGFWGTAIETQSIQAYIRTMTNALARRGPDAAGFFTHNTQPQLALGHRRLRILDLSDKANQPFFSACQRYVMVYNGEVFNFRDLARKYRLSCRTESDTEVILALFALLGPDCAREFNGMFAMAIFDLYEKRLWLMRDRLGIKPLFYYHNPQQGVFAFASEIKSFAACEWFKGRLSLSDNAIAYFLHLGYLPHQTTIYSQIQKFPQGHFGVFDGLHCHFTPFWSPEEQLQPNTFNNEKAAKEQLKQLLLSAVQYRLISDVPLGTFLSGGIDSSLVTALAQAQTQQPICSFSIGFKEAKFDETQYARAVAKHLRTNHHEFIVSKDDALDRFVHLTDIYDEPFADSSAIPTLLVAQMARQYVTVALAGDGGDELFMGYGTYRWATRLAHGHWFWAHKTIGKVLQFMPNNWLKRGGRVFDYPDRKHLKSHIFSQEAYLFSTQELAFLLKQNHLKYTLNGQWLPYDPLAQKLSRKLSASEEQALFDLKNYLPDDLLVKVDRASMYHALEVRVPLLDYRVVKFALNLPLSLKYRNETSKYLLKQVLYDYIPSAFFERPKRGFAVPIELWLKNELRYLIDHYLADDFVRHIDLLNPEAVQTLKKQFFKGRSYLYNRIWAIILLHKWIDEHQNIRQNNVFQK